VQGIPNHDLSYTQNRELSWLRFNERVLAEAADPNVPLIERLRFVSIFTSNLDEFFMVRVGSLFDLNLMAPTDRDNKSGETPSEQLDAIFAAVHPLIERRDAILRALNDELSRAGVAEIPYEALTDVQRAYVRDYYREFIKPLLSPQIIDRSHPFPFLKNKALYVAALLSGPVLKAAPGKAGGKSGDKAKAAEKAKGGDKLKASEKAKAPEKAKALIGIVDVPSSVPPIIMLPGGNTQFIRTESVVAAHVKKTFKIYTVEEQAVISVTRNADISMDEEKFDEDVPDYLNYMSRLVKKRERLAPVRLELQGSAPRLAKHLAQSLKLDMRQVYTCDAPLKLGYAYQLDKCPANMYYAPHPPVYPDYLDRERPMAEQIRERDILLFYPYQSMQPFLDLLKQSASDPAVVSIKITIYRLARNSAIAKSLCEAAENGKSVTVLMELRARFDEQNNIEWTRELEEAGCRILYGPEGYKCHAKICLITRRERQGFSYITQVGTGNYNEKTSTLYTDFCMMTADPGIAQDAVSFFENMQIGNLSDEYEQLLVAPLAMKSRLIDMIDGQIALGSRGRIIIKANSVTERELIDKLMEASCAGVSIDLIIRGICCIVPGVPGKTENIRVRSIVGRFLEHSRIYSFGEGDNRRLYLSSADIMTRNQLRRVEVGAPVRSEEIRQVLIDYLERLLKDNTKAWKLESDGTYTDVVPAPGEEVRSVQTWYLDNPLRLRASAPARTGLRQRLRRFWERGGKQV